MLLKTLLSATLGVMTLGGAEAWFSFSASGPLEGVLQPFEHSVSVSVSYGSTRVSHGDDILPSTATSQPTVRLNGAEPKKLYALLMVDPDAPDPAHPVHKEYVHWIVTNISGGDEDISGGEVVLSYKPPTPPIGKHRYVLTVAEQPGDAKIDVDAPTDRSNFSTKRFLDDHDLKPVGGLVFTAEKKR